MADLINNTIGENYNHFTNGMDLDTNDTFIAKDSYRYAENIRIVCDKGSTNGEIQSVSDKIGISGISTYCDNLEDRGNSDFVPNWINMSYGLNDMRLPSGYGTIVGIRDIRNYTVIFTFSPATTPSTKYGTLRIFKLIFNGVSYQLKEIANATLYLDKYYQNINNFSVIIRYEDTDNIKVYWADGYNLIRVINIADKYDDRNISVTDIRQFNIDPLVSFSAPKFIGLGTGSLKSGKVQYAYQLFNVNGCETELSPCTGLITLTNSNNNVGTSNLYKGAYYNENTNKSVKLKIELDNNTYERLKLVSVHYTSTTNLPTINVVGDYNIKGLLELYIEDTGSVVLSELTLAEFNLIKGVYIIPRVLESKYNYLFAGNTTYNDISIDYDARSYRFASVYDTINNNLYFYLKLVSINSDNTIDKIFTYDDFIGNTTILDDYLSSIATDHDCINEYNDTSKEDFEFTESNTFDPNNINYNSLTGLKFNKGIIRNDSRYTDGSYLIHGGRGLNVDYEFITTTISLDDNQIDTQIGDSATIFKSSKSNLYHSTVTKKNIDGFHINTSVNKYQAGTITPVVFNEFKTLDQSVSDFTDYSGVVMDYYVKSLQRDEIYRYGCRLYDEFGRKSDVKWIGDIRTPSMQELGYESYNADSTISFKQDKSDSIRVSSTAKPLGLRFYFRNLPTNIKGVEIVRVNRTLDNSSVLTQGLIYKVYDAGTSGYAYGTTTPTNWCNFYDGRYQTVNNTKVNLSDLPNNKKILKYIFPDVAYDDTFVSKLKNYSKQLVITNGLFSKDFVSNVYNSGSSNTAWSCGINTHNYGYVSNFTGIYDLFAYDTQSFINNTFPDQLNPSSNHMHLMYQNVWGPWFDFDNTKEYEDYYLSVFHNNGIYIKLFNQGTKIYTNNTVQDIQYKIDVDNVVKSNDCNYDNMFNYWDISTSLNNISLINVNTFDFDSVLAINITAPEWSDYNMIGYGVCPEDTVGYIQTSSDYTSTIKNVDRIHTVITKDFDIDSTSTNFTIYNNSSVNNADKYLTAPFVYVANLKQKVSPYGGSGFLNRSQSEYESIQYIPNTTGSVKDTIFNGDTYICLYNHAYNRRFFPVEERTDSDNDNRVSYAITRKFTNLVIPLETRLNLNLTQGLEFNRDGNLNTQLTPVDISKIGTQDKPKYIYNQAYSLEPTATVGTVKSIYDIYNKHIDNRVHYSLAKINDEIIDTWSKFNALDYLDLDSRYGSINNLKLFKNRLLSFQNNGIALLSVKERSVVTDNNNAKLVIGSGDILDRFDYISTFYGMKTNHINAIEFNDQILTFYDGFRNEILAFDESLISLSKSKKVQSYLNTNINNIINNPAIVYDKKYNEFIYNLTSDKSLIYNTFLNNFTSFFTINSSDLFYNNTEILTNSNGYLYSYRNSSTSNNLMSKLNIIINDIPTDTKVFDNVEFISTIPTTPMKVQFITDQQTSNVVTSNNMRCKESTYYFAIPRAIMDSDFPDRMRGNTIQCNYTFDKSINQFNIPYIKTKYRISRS